MDSKILNTQIDEAVAEFILNKVTEYKSALDEGYKAKQDQLFQKVDKLVESREEDIKEEYSARMISKLKEKNDYVAQLEESIESTKEELAERVNAFLSNSKEDVRALVEEELRVDSETLKAQRTIDEIRNLVGNNPVISAPAEDNGRASRLEEDVQVLKERLGSKTEAVNKLKAQLRVFQLVESVPTGDREFYLAQLKSVNSVNEADETFTKVKKAIRASRLESIEKDVRKSGSRGVISEDRVDHSPRVPSNGETNVDRMKKLAGL